jgi:hypothetical protein
MSDLTLSFHWHECVPVFLRVAPLSANEKGDVLV